MEEIVSAIKKQPVWGVVAAGLFTVIGSITTGYFAGERAVVESQPDLLRLATETLQKTNQDLITRVAVLEERLQALVNENTSLKNEIRTLRIKVNQQFNEIRVQEAYSENMPGPAWMKNIDLEMLFINRAYEREWGVTKLKYEGYTDFSVWPEAIAKRFVANDSEVISCRCAIRTVEQVPRSALKPVDKQNPLNEWVIWKWPVVLDEEIIGVAGAAFEP